MESINENALELIALLTERVTKLEQQISQLLEREVVEGVYYDGLNDYTKRTLGVKHDNKQTQ